MRFRLLSLFALLILFYGCIQQTGSFKNYAADYADSLTWKEIAGAGKEAQVGNCTCMVCEEGVAIWGTQESLAGITCKFDNECNESKLMDYINESTALGDKYNPRRFMIGQGPSISEFSAANPLCSNSLKMAVHWLLGSENKPYDTPDPERAICLLDKDVLPVYVLYSNGTNIDYNQAGLIAAKLGQEGTLIRKGQLAGPVGPVIIVTELDFNSSDPDAINNITQQIIEIDNACNDWRNPADPKIYCYAAVAPRMGDTQGLDAVMTRLQQALPTKPLSKLVMLAYGINSHYANGYCNGDKLIVEAAAFSKYARNKYNLSSVIPYVLIDVNQKDATGRCIWRQGEAVKTYNSLFITGIPTLIKNSVIGFALYSPSADSWSNPLGCVDCGVVQDQMRKQAWFGNCQNYYGIQFDIGGGQTETIKTIPNLIWFPNNDEARCGTGSEQVSTSFVNILYSLKEYGAEAIDIINPSSPPKMKQDEETLWTCDSCLAEKRKITDIFKDSGGSNVMYKVMPPVSDEALQQTGRSAKEDILCEAYPELDYYASKLNVDPLLLRATAAAESGFDKCAAAIVLSPELSEAERSGIESALASQGKAAVPGVYSLGYTFMEDPDGECRFLDFNGWPYTYTRGGETYAGASYVGLSIIQFLESPYTFWPGNQYADEFERAKNDGRKEEIEKVNATCGEGFNPFNVSNAACWGAAKFATLIRDSEQEAKNVAINQSDRDEVMVLQALIAEYKYMGLWGRQASKTFSKEWCIGQGSLSVGQCLSDSYKDSGATCEESRRGECIGDGCKRDLYGNCVPDESPDESNCYYSIEKPKDFIWFVDCVIKNEGGSSEILDFYGKGGLKRLAYYAWLTENCKTASCPSWKKLNDILQTYQGDDNPYNDYQDFFKYP